jgi:hypothetical protein
MIADLDTIKAALPDYLQRYHCDRITRISAGKIEMHCPFHEDKHPSFTADNRKGTWLFKCFSCGAAGTLLDLHAQTSGERANSRASIEAAAASVGVVLPDRPKPTLQQRRQWLNLKHKTAEKERRIKFKLVNQENITAKIQSVLESKLAPYLSEHWKVELWERSPITITHNECAPHDFLLSMFKPDDILWLGLPKDSGRAEHADNFRTCSEWLKLDVLPQRIAAGTFKPGSNSRSMDSVNSTPFIVIESDDLIGHKPSTPEERERNKSLSSALIGYAQDKLGLTLRAVIDTGNKSLHAWFDRPPQAALDAIKRMAAGLHIDSAILDRCQAAPLRMPHCVHEKTNKTARLLYLNPIIQ